MKKILLLFILIFSVSLRAQTLQNPTFGNTTTNTLKIKTPATVTSVNFLSTIEADGSISKIDPVSLGFALDANVLHKTGNETFSGLKTGSATSSSTATTGFHFENNYSGGVGNILNAPIQVLNTDFGIGVGAYNQGSGWLYSGANASTGTIFNFNTGVGATGDQIAHNVNNVKVGGVDYLGRASYPSATLGTNSNTSVAQLTVKNGSNPNVIEFPKTGFTMNGTVGALGSYEMNMSTNMDYTSSPGVHKFYDNTRDATWLAIFPEGWQMQWMAAAGTAGDVWNAQGQPRQLIQYRGMMRINTTAALSTPGSTFGDSMFGVRRNAGFASISGESDLAIEGGKTKGVSAPVFINSYNSADVGIASGGGKVGIGTNTPNYNLHVNSTGTSSSIQLTSSTTGATASDGFAIGTNAIGGAEINQLENNYIRFLLNGSEKSRMHASGGVSIGNTTDTGAGTLNVTGAIYAPTAASGTNTTQVATTAFVNSALPTSGTYTPTTSSLVNITSISNVSGVYTRVGNIVTVAVRFLANETVGATQTSFIFTLPINRTGTSLAYNFGTGNVSGSGGANKTARVDFNANNSTALFTYLTLASFGSNYGSATFQYDITQ